MSKKILIIDDDTDLCILLGKFLTKNGYETEMAHSGAKGIAKYKDGKFDVVICDFRLGDMEGSEVLRLLKKEYPGVKVLMITGYSDIKTAVEVIKMGAFDYIVKPLVPDEVLSVLQKADQHSDPDTDRPESGSRRKGVHLAGTEKEFMIGDSPVTITLYEQINVVAATNYSIILYGESGTGKEVIAKTVHQLSNRKHKPFVAMDCGTLSKELAGSELFGHVKGAFTGALQDKEGHFELADGGTLFLDEVGNLSLDVQATLLRVIQERKFKRVGGNKEMNADVRIIVASNENLQDAYRKGKFREDLYHRFNEFSISLPPLRTRREDIAAFAAFFLERTNDELDKNVTGFDEDVLSTFLTYSWPGNLREFRNVVRRAVLLTAPGKKISSATLPWEITNGAIIHPKEEMATASTPAPAPFNSRNELDLKNAASRAEYETIMAALQKVNFNKKKAAEVLNIDRKTLYNKIKEFQNDSKDGQ